MGCGWRRLHAPPAQCAGQTFRYHAGRLHVAATGPATSTEAPPEAKRRRLAQDIDAPAHAMESMDGPSVALLGLDPAAMGYGDEGVHLVSHRDAVFFLAHLKSAGLGNPDPDHAYAAGVWRLSLARNGDGGMRMAWEPVSLLGVRQVVRLVAPLVRGGCADDTPASVESVCGVFTLGGMLCCRLKVRGLKMCVFTGWRRPRMHHLVLALWTRVSGRPSSVRTSWWTSWCAQIPKLVRWRARLPWSSGRICTSRSIATDVAGWLAGRPAGQEAGF